MTSIFSTQNTAAENSLKYNEENKGKSYTNFHTPIKTYPNTNLKSTFQYYDSKLTIGHEYPKMEYIRPYNTDYVVSGDRVLESIQAHQRFAIGNNIVKNRISNLWY
jgi:hypothetical protein